MQKNVFFLYLLIMISWLSACSSSTYQKSVTYNPQSHKTEEQHNTPFFQLDNEILPHKLALTLVTHLKKEAIPGSYTLKKYTRRLLPNDYMAQADTMLYLKNLSQQTINFKLLAISIEHKRLPRSARILSLSANEYLSIPLGEIDIDLRLNSLITRIEYIADGVAIEKEHQEKLFDMPRIIRIKETETGEDDNS